MSGLSRGASADSPASTAPPDWIAADIYFDVGREIDSLCVQLRRGVLGREREDQCTGFETSAAHLKSYVSSSGALEWFSVNHSGEKGLFWTELEAGGVARSRSKD